MAGKTNTKTTVPRNILKAGWERKRVAKKAEAFDCLRAKLAESMPDGPRTTQLDTLQTAINLIGALQAMLEDSNEAPKVLTSSEMPFESLVARESPEDSQEIQEEENMDDWFVPQEQLQVPLVNEDFPMAHHLPAPVQEVSQNVVAPESPQMSQQEIPAPASEVFTETPFMTHVEYEYDSSQRVFHITPYFSHPVCPAPTSPAQIPQEEVLMYQPAYYRH